MTVVCLVWQSPWRKFCQRVPAFPWLKSAGPPPNLMAKRFCGCLGFYLSSAKWERLKGRNGSLSKIFAYFCRFGSLICKVSGSELQKTAEKTTGNCRKSQEAVSTPFSHLVSPIKRCPIYELLRGPCMT